MYMYTRTLKTTNTYNHISMRLQTRMEKGRKKQAREESSREEGYNSNTKKLMVWTSLNDRCRV